MNSLPMPRHPQPAYLSTPRTEADYFLLNGNPPPDEDLTVVCGGQESCTAKNPVERTSQPYYTIEFVALGDCRITLNQQSFDLGPGSVYGYGPGTPHRIENRGDSRMVKFFVCLQGRKVADLLWPCFLKHNRPVHVAEYRWIHDLFRMLMDCGQRNGPATQESCQLIVRLLLDRVEQLSSRANRQQEQAQMTFQRCRSYISHNFRKIRSIGEVARHCGVHRAYLAQLFTRFAQTTPSQLINHYKMNAAAKLLLEGDLLVKEIAAEVGFDDPLYFSHTFKKFFGVSPRTFAERARPPQPALNAVPDGCEWRQAAGN